MSHMNKMLIETIPTQCFDKNFNIFFKLFKLAKTGMLAQFCLALL
jgi:hypothetical protein